MSSSSCRYLACQTLPLTLQLCRGLFLFTPVLVVMLAGCADTDPDSATLANATIEKTETANKLPLVKPEQPQEATGKKQEAVKKDVSNEQPAPQSDAKAAARQNSPPDVEEPRLMKTNTLLMLTHQSDIRATKMVDTVRPFISEDQARQAKKLASTYNWRFEDILRRRAEILENASDDQDIKGKLLATRVETADLIQEIRARISVEILTPEQRLQVQERYQAE